MSERCPKCDGVEWFPGAACFHCGWEGSAADAFAMLRSRLAAREQELAGHMPETRAELKRLKRELAEARTEIELLRGVNEDQGAAILKIRREALLEARRKLDDACIIQHEDGTETDEFEEWLDAQLADEQGGEGDGS